MKLAVKLLLGLCLCQGGEQVPDNGQLDSLLAVNWNLENFFDWKDGGTTESDAEFSSGGKRHWTKRRFYDKCSGVAKTLLLISDTYGRLPDIVGMEEVENRFVVSQIVNSTPLRKLDYGIVHFESPDHRGIDCALLYRKSTLHLKRACPKHILDSTGAIMATRDILLAEFDSLSVLVNHHPSKVGGKEDRRQAALSRMQFLCDSLSGRVLCIGDFNQDLWHSEGGTTKYNGLWEKIDGCFYRNLSVREDIFFNPSLLTQDRTFGGMKPLRTYSGPKYLGGISDHLPVVFTIFY